MTDRTTKDRIVHRVFWAVAILNIVLALLLNSADTGGSDAAGNGLAKAFALFIMIATFVVLAILSGLFLLVKRTWFRIALILVSFGMAIAVLVNVIA